MIRSIIFLLEKISIDNLVVYLYPNEFHKLKSYF
jgi:hypothetical protein